MVLNEFGGVDGLVTLKDVIDFVFGHTGAGEALSRRFIEPEPGIFEVDGAMKLADFNAITNAGIDDRRMTTISGVVLRHLDRLPALGDEVTVEDMRLQVVSLEGHRIDRLRVMPVSHRPQPQTAAPDQTPTAASEAKAETAAVQPEREEGG